MKNIVLVNYIELVSCALLDFLNSEIIPINAKGKLVVNLTNKNQKKLSYFLESNLKDKMYFGKETVIIKPCEIKNNWRCNINNFSTNVCKYNIIDDSVWIEPQKLSLFCDKEFYKLKNKFIKSKFIYNENVDSIDLLLCFQKLLNVNLISDNLYYIVEDGNNIFNRDNYWPSFVLSNVELLLKENNLLL